MDRRLRTRLLARRQEDSLSGLRRRARLRDLHRKDRRGGETKVTNNVKDEEAPSYSPDGKKIAYECFKDLGSADDEDFDYEICTIKIGGGGKSQVTNTKYYGSVPSWGSRPEQLLLRAKRAA